MDPISSLPTTPLAFDPLARDLADVDAAIGMVAAGLARRVQLVGLTRPDVVAAVALARTQAAGLRFEVDRGSDGPVTLTVGPRSNRQRVG